MKGQKFIDVRTLSLEHIVAVKTESWESFRGTISSSLSGHEFQELKNRLLRAEAPNTALKIKRQLEYIQTILSACKEAVLEGEKCEQELSGRKTLHKFALGKLERAKQDLAIAEELLNAAEAECDRIEKSLMEINQLLEDSRKDLESKKRLILIHPSTNLKQIIEHRDGVFMTTKADEELLRKIGCVDRVFESEISFIEIIPQSIREKYQTSDLFSIISYANMIIHIALTEDDSTAYKFLYSNKDINTILKVNGFEL